MEAHRLLYIPPGYDPMGPIKLDCRIGQLTVKGNDMRATVCRQGVLLSVAIHEEDNGDGIPPGQPPSAFVRCVQWAEKNQP